MLLLSPLNILSSFEMFIQRISLEAAALVIAIAINCNCPAPALRTSARVGHHEHGDAMEDVKESRILLTAANFTPVRNQTPSSHSYIAISSPIAGLVLQGHIILNSTTPALLSAGATLCKLISYEYSVF